MYNPEQSEGSIQSSGVARGVHAGSYAPSPYTSAPSTVMFT